MMTENEKILRILVTGASGFIGSFIVEEALRMNMEVWAAVRKGSSKRYLQDSRINFVELNFNDEVQMSNALCSLPRLNYAVHAAGATKALRCEDFFRTNTQGTINLVKALEKSNPSIKRLVFISSLSVMGAVREAEPYTEILDSDIPQPNTAYGKSKLAAEEWLQKECKLPFTILRPTGVYGPREKDYMLMVDSIRKGLDTAVGFKRQDITFVYVRDVVQAVFKSMKSDKTIGKAYFLSDGEVYSSRDFSNLIIDEMGKKHVLRLTFPLWVLKFVCAVSDFWMHITGTLSTLNNDHYNILKQRNWRCDISPAKQDFGFLPQWKLKDGVHEIIKGLKD